MAALAVLVPRQLREGDVLLSYGHGGKGSSSYWARHFDGGDYSHAAYWDGRRVVEAVGEGVLETSIERHLAEHEYVDVYRFQSSGATLGDPGWPADVVTKAARAHLGAAYATSQLAVIALLVGSGRRIGWPAFEAFLRSASGASFRAEIQRWKEAPEKRPLVCSQLVAAAFRAAEPSGRYALRRWIEPGVIAAPPDAEPEAASELAALRRDCAAIFVGPAPPRAEPVPAADRPPARTGGGVVLQPLTGLLGATRREIELGAMVTPRDLAESSTLKVCGRLG